MVREIGGREIKEEVVVDVLVVWKYEEKWIDFRKWKLGDGS